MARRTFVQLLRDRLSKQGWYDTPAYWDMKADVYSGLARSNWPSNVFNRHWDARQMALLDEALGDVRGLRVADVACGTGRASRHLARRGASVTGFDFAPKTLDAARIETRAESLSVDYELYDVKAPPPARHVEAFDLVVTISCLAMACADDAMFEAALAHLVAFVRPGGRLLLLEPIHSSWLLRRILKLSTRSWISRARAVGLELVSSRGMGFVPVRLLCAFREFPEPLVGAAFWAGERFLDGAPSRMRFSDYKCLLFRKASGVADRASNRPGSEGGT